MAGLVLGVPAAVQELIQKGLLERAFHDGLYPNLAYRAEALAELWEGQQGQEIFMTRPGLLKPRTRPLKPGQDPSPQEVPYEQWVARLEQYGDTIDTHMPTSNLAAQNQFLRNIHQLGLQAGQSVNRVARNAMFKAYLSGRTVLIATASAGVTQVRVAALNGFTDVVIPGGNVAPKSVSAAYPLPITIGTGGSKQSNTVIGATPDNADDPDGPGTLLLGSAIGGGGFAARVTVDSAYGVRIVRPNGGATVDALTAGDTLTLQQIINAVAYLRDANVQPHDDGLFHAHISPLANAQVFADPVYQRLNQSLPEHANYKEGFIGSISGVAFFMNTESPTDISAGDLTLTGTNAQYASDIGAEVTNETAIRVGRVLITGKGSVYEKYLDEGAFVTEAGTTGKIGEFDVVNNGVTIATERIRLIIRAPLDRLQQKVACTWSISTSFPVPSDITAPSGPQRFKRAIVLEHALG